MTRTRPPDVRRPALQLLGIPFLLTCLALCAGWSTTAGHALRVSPLAVPGAQADSNLVVDPSAYQALKWRGVGPHRGGRVFLNNLWFSKVEKEKEIAFFPIETKEAKEYINEMNDCIDFAFANRMLIMENIKKCFNKILNNKIEYDYIINIAHNYARYENHFGKNVLIHRKGATSARLNEIGIIPGSQGSKSYIVKGLGNKESFESCSHGAGRKMGRGQAQRELNLDADIKHLNDNDVIHSIRSVKDLDEATGDYKSIDEVMENQKDLIEIVTELKPIAVIKG